MERVHGLFEHYALDYSSCEFLAIEFIFAFIDKWHESIGLEINDNYTLEDIEEALHTTFPTPSQLIIGFGINEVSFGVLEEFLNNLRENGINQVTRIYSRPDMSRLRKHGGLVFNAFSREDLERNIRKFYENLVPTYDKIVENNFPQLKDKLRLFKGATRLLIKLDLKEYYTGFHDSPKLFFIALKNEEEDNLEIEVFTEVDKEIPSITRSTYNIGLNYKGKRYNLLYRGETVIDFMFEDWPMLHYIYKLLREKFREIYEEYYYF